MGVKVYIHVLSILTFKRRVAILEQIIEVVRVTLDEVPDTRMKNRRDGDKQLLVFPEVLEARHYD